ncbi:MAG: DEAD/DEAH box helicase [Candidatus Marinimicrobia bacterium]|nr:DEAD/DEAH box helicase [Candidatus Neomarinimicrobiota bacterium]
MNNFAETSLKAEIKKAIKELNFENMTPIQAKTIPHLLSSNQDVIASAETGTGKTAAFGLPLIHLTNIEDKTPQTLILCPTRELCIQIARDLTNYSKFIKGLNIVAVYGGASIETQMKALRKGAHIVIGTPGRTKDLIKRKKLFVGNVKRLVLDEADEMLSMGFKEDIDKILSKTSQERQTLLFSATISGKIVDMKKQYLNTPLVISVAKTNKGADNVKHIYYIVQAKDRYEVLKRIADINPNIYGIVFCRTRRETKEVTNKLIHDGYNADAIHGDLSQAQREEVMGNFRKRRLQMLVATDVAARGLDVHSLTHVINYNLPDDSEIYIHRSGRTGRAGKSGISIAITHTRETGKIKAIERISGISFSRESVPSGKDICKKQLYALIDKIEKVEVDETQIEPFLPEIYNKLEWLDRERLIRHFVSAEFNRFLAYYKNAKDINTSEERSKSKKRTKEERRKTSFVNLYINIGTKNRLNPVRLMGLINKALGTKKAIVGKINIQKTFSFFEIEEDKINHLIKALRKENYDGMPLLVDISEEKSEGLSSSKQTFSNKRREKKDKRRKDRNSRNKNNRQRKFKGKGRNEKK